MVFLVAAVCKEQRGFGVDLHPGLSFATFQHLSRSDLGLARWSDDFGPVSCWIRFGYQSGLSGVLCLVRVLSNIAFY